MFSLDLRTITGDVDMPHNNFKTQDFNPQGILILDVCLFPISTQLKWVLSLAGVELSLPILISLNFCLIFMQIRVFHFVLSS